MADKTSLSIPVSPRLPSAPKDWEQTFMDNYSRVLALYFRQLDAANSGLLGRSGGAYMNNPFGSFQNTVTQTLTAANTPYVVALNSTDFSVGVSLASNRITVTQSGIYNVQFSLQFENTTAQIVDIFVWLRRNGADVTGTGSTWAVTSAHGGTNGYMIGACNFFLNLTGGDYIELVAAADATGLNIEAYPSSTSPFTRPSIPSSVVTLAFVSSPPK